MKTYREHRFPCELAVQVRGPGGSQPAALVNISPGGARLSRIEGPQPGETLRLDLGSGEPVPATVRWARDGMAGLRFPHPLTRDQVTRLRSTVSGVRVSGWTGRHAGLREIH